MKIIITESQYNLLRENKNKKFLTKVLGQDLVDSIQKITSTKQLSKEFLKHFGSSKIVQQHYIDSEGPLYYFVLDGEPFIYKQRISDDTGEKWEIYYDDKGHSFYNNKIPEKLGIDVMGLNFSDVIDIFHNEGESLNENVDDKKIKVMEKYVDSILSDYDWYEGIDKVSVEKYRLSGNHKRSIPLYVFYVTTNDYKKSYHEYKEEFYDTSIYDEIDDMFNSLFPYDKPGPPSAVWVVRWVML